MLPLFDDPPSFDRQALAERLRELARRNILIGTSSWKYEGWQGQIYSRDRYYSRNKFSQKRFEAECLAEYAETFPIVCGDFSFYQFPSPQHWERLFASARESLKFALKVPEEITVLEFPAHPRYAARAGLDNPTFLDVELFRSSFTTVLAPHRERVAVLIFEFGFFSQRCFPGADDFIAVLDPFLGALPLEFRYAVEVRNPEFLTPGYFECLKRNGVAHVFNAWTRMPELNEQIRINEAFITDFTVVRALLRRGRPYEEAVQRFSPYDRVQDEYPEAREALRTLILQAKERRHSSYIFVNNRLEGNAPATIEAIVND